MKNVIKLTTAAMMMSTAAFAEVGTNWDKTSIDADNILADATFTTYDAAAAKLEKELMGGAFTTYSPVKNGKLIDLNPTTTIDYSRDDIIIEINAVKAALALDVLGDSDGIELDGEDEGILGTVANSVLTQAAAVNKAVADFLDEVADGDAKISDWVVVDQQITDLTTAKDNFNTGIVAYDLIIADLEPLDEYESVVVDEDGNPI